MVLGEEGLSVGEGGEVLIHASFAIGGYFVASSCVFFGGAVVSEHSIWKI
jgi:hypothetical protein